MTAQELLRLIEAVDPRDTAKLDEIDARVDLYLDAPEMEFCGLSVRGIYYRYKGKDQYERSVDLNSVAKVTRSRDALKAIRPDGYEWGKTATQYHATKKLNDRHQLHIIGNGATEELAELHAIIQAIDHDHNNGEKP
jgi:hypothetical protein